MRHELIIEKDSPFKNCKLNRKIYADVLTELLRSGNEGFVMALNNKWGTGKTSFVKMWKYHLENIDFQTIYFNAWENDFENNALTALIGELKPIVKPSSQSSFNKVVEKGLILSKHVFPILIKSVIDKYIDSKSLKENLNNLADETKETFKSEIDEYLKRKENIIEFKETLKEFVANTVTDKPLVFIIDELDRCRPNYSVELLEQVKHFFSVPNIVFILSIDKQQLKHAIEGVYGSNQIDSEEYLRRFIDLEYSLPEPEKKEFIEYLYDYYNLKEYFEEKNSEIAGNDKETFIRICNYLFSSKKVTLRQQEKIFSHISSVLKTCNKNRQVFPFLFVCLVFFKLLHSNFYDRIRLNDFTLIELQNELLKIFANNIDQKAMLTAIESNLLFFYNNAISPNNQLFIYNAAKFGDELTIKSIYNDAQLLLNLKRFEDYQHDYQFNSIDKIIARIELISQT